MDKRIKFSLEEKVKVVRAILAGRESSRSAAIKIGAHNKTIHCWVGLYKHHGVAGLKIRPGSYPGKFKVEVIAHMLKNNLSLVEAASYFGIPCDQAVRRWLKKYELNGNKGLLHDGRGRKRSIMGKKPKKVKKALTGSIEERLAALQSENEYLRAENAFLKKAEALIQEQKAAQKQNTQQKPSKN